jgi:NAD kinase
VELDRQHLADVDLMVAVGGDGTVLSSAHFLDHGTIPLLGINSDPNVSREDIKVVKKKTDERRYVRKNHSVLVTAEMHTSNSREWAVFAR